MIYLTPVTRLFISISALFIALSALLWLRKYYESITCILGPDAITLQRGVWIRRTITVPYKKITGIDIIRKRLHSYLGISSLRVNYTTSESLHAVIRIDGTQDPERLHSIIINNLNAVPGQG
jgi:uncharacterized membrane protein YdbT with pleckstrin-like domain